MPTQQGFVFSSILCILSLLALLLLASLGPTAQLLKMARHGEQIFSLEQASRSAVACEIMEIRGLPCHLPQAPGTLTHHHHEIERSPCGRARYLIAVTATDPSGISRSNLAWYQQGHLGCSKMPQDNHRYAWLAVNHSEDH